MDQPTDRRTQIADVAIEVIAGDGIKALTHRRLDTVLDLPAGSTSYYFRTRGALLGAVAERIVDTSRTDFAASGLAPEAGNLDTIGRAIAAALDGTLERRQSQLIARCVVAIELPTDSPLRAALATSLFSRSKAAELFRVLGADDPGTTAADFVSLFEGLVFDRIFGARSLDGLVAGTEASRAQLARPLQMFLRGLRVG